MYRRERGRNAIEREQEKSICVFRQKKKKMSTKYTSYSPNFIHNVLLQYRKGVKGYGFAALAKKNNIKGGKQMVSYWYSKWDGTESSLTKQSGGDTRSILTDKEKKTHIRDYVVKKSKVEAATYREVKKNVETKTKKSLSLTTVKRGGKSQNITSKKRKRVPKSQGLFHSVFSIFSSLSRNCT